MGPWIKISDIQTIQPETLLLFYFPQGNFVWATAQDKEKVVTEYPNITHFRVMVEAPE